MWCDIFETIEFYHVPQPPVYQIQNEIVDSILQNVKFFINFRLELDSKIFFWRLPQTWNFKQQQQNIQTLEII